MTTTRVVILAASPALRAGLHALLNSAAIVVVGETAVLPDNAPDDAVLVLGDETMLPTMTRTPARGQALVLLSDDERLVAQLRALALRGWALLSPEATPAELQAAVLAAAQGMVVLPLPLANRLVGQRSVIEQPAEALTLREGEVLTLISQGLSNKLIARQLQISEHTVKFHIASVFTKLGASSRTEAVSLGARSGLIVL